MMLQSAEPTSIQFAKEIQLRDININWMLKNCRSYHGYFWEVSSEYLILQISSSSSKRSRFRWWG